MLEEESVELPMLRYAFSQAEVRPVVKQMIKGLTPADMAWYVRPMGDVLARQKYLLEKSGIPGFVVSMVMMPAVHKYEREVVAPVAALIAGAVEGPPVDASCIVM